MPAPRPAFPRAKFAAVALLATATALLPHSARAHGVHDEGMARPVGVPALASAPVSPLPQPAAVTNRYYIGNDDHSDYMWSGDDIAYRSAFLSMLDFYMTQAETTAWRPWNERARFNCDGTDWIWEYERHRPRSQFVRLMNHLRDSSITIPFNTCVQLYGAMPAEAVLRSFYYAGRLQRRENIPLSLVVPMEDQTLPGGVASLWAGSGARFSWKGICNCATQINAGARPRDAYRFTGPDGQSVLMLWHSLYNSTNISLGGYAEARDPAAAVNFMENSPYYLAAWPWSVHAAFGYGWDDLETFTHAFVEAAHDLTTTGRRVIVSNEVDFFRDFEATHGSELASYGAGFGNDWEIFSASLGEVTSRMKRGVERLRSAEALATIATLLQPGFMTTARIAERDSAELSCGLYYEHSWSAGPGVDTDTRQAWQRQIEHAMTRYSDNLLAAARGVVAAHIADPGGDEAHFVFNPLSWARTEAVDLATDVHEPRHVVDAVTHEEVPSQTVGTGVAARLRILASDVPPVGYRVYRVVPGAGAAFPPAASVAGATASNAHYAVTLGSRGEITSVLDHGDGDRELVGAGAALNDVGAGAGTGSVEVENAGPVSTTLLVSCASPLRRETRVTLYAGVDRIDVDNHITENFSGTTAYTYAFNLPGMTMRHEEVGRISKVARLADGGDYADENTRTDYLTMNHFVDLSQSARGVTLSCRDASFFAAGNSDVFTLDGNTPSIRALVGTEEFGGSGNGNQGGDQSFLSRYALRTHGAWNPADAMRLALEHQNPLGAGRVTSGRADARLPQAQWSLLTVDSPDVLLWTLKPAEDGASHGIVARLWNMANGASTATLSLPPLGIASAMRATHVETDLGAAPVSGGTLTESFAPQQLRTWRLIPEATLSVPPPAGETALALSAGPNPLTAGASANVSFVLPSAGRARLVLVDVTGARVATLLDGELDAGRNQVTWSGITDRGGAVKTGVYFLRLEAAGRSADRRVVVVK